MRLNCLEAFFISNKFCDGTEENFGPQAKALVKA
jgi:hypothetical protein